MSSATSTGRTATGSGPPVRDDRSDLLRSVLDVDNRPPRAGAFAASGAHLWRSVTAFRHNPVQLVDMVLLPFIFLLLFTYVFGGAFGGSTSDYLQFFLPGILVQTVVLMTVYTGTALNRDINKGIHDRFRTLPVWQPAPIVGNLLGDVVRYVVALVATTALGLALGFRPAAGVLGVLGAMLALIVFGFSVSWLFAALGILVRETERVSGTSMIAIYPLLFMSNIFVPPQTMPGWMQAIVAVNPMTHAADVSRGLMQGTVTPGRLGLLAAVCAGFVVVFGSLTLYLYRTKNAD